MSSGSDGNKDDILNDVEEIRQEARKRRIIATRDYQKFAAMADRAKEKGESSEVTEALAALQLDMIQLWSNTEKLAKLSIGNTKTIRMQMSILALLLRTVKDPQLLGHAAQLIKENNEFIRSLQEK